MAKPISIVVPVYNEGKNLPVLFAELEKVTSSLQPAYDFEFVFVNDGSTDNTQTVLENLAAARPAVRAIEFSRNFGKELAITAGLHAATGQATIVLDADLQHPPELIPQFLQKWEHGSYVVVGVRQNNSGESLLKRTGSNLFYRLMGSISSTEFVPQSTDFRLIDRAVLDEFNKFTERSRITRGLLDWMGFAKDHIYFTAPQRRFGTPSYSTARLFRLALSSIVSHSLFPLKFAGYLGLFITAGSGLLGLFMLVEKYLLGDPLNLKFSGPAQLAVLILFLIGLVLSCLGLIALYIGNIHEEMLNRPLYIIKKKRHGQPH